MRSEKFDVQRVRCTTWWLGLLGTTPSSFRSRDEGQTLVEYALILVLVAVVVITAAATLGHTVRGIFSDVSSSI